MKQTHLNANASAWQLPQQLGLESEIKQLKKFISEWIEECDPEMKEMIRRQFSGKAKYFRPVTVFACFRAISDAVPHSYLVPSAVALELTHNVSLIIDDILDRSRYRRGKLSLHCRYGFLPALMAAGYITSAAQKLVASDAYSVRLLADLIQRLGVAECLQWRLRRQLLGVEDWRVLASEDTGSMFETCACLGTRDDSLQKFGHLLGVLYHGCDDVADVRGTAALGGGSERDIQDGILTLPVAIAIRNPETALLFRDRTAESMAALTEKLVLALPESEEYLDRIASEAETEAIANSKFPDLLLALVRHTRALSKV